MQQTVNLYEQILNNLINSLDKDFRNQLTKETQIETLDLKWKNARKNIEKFLQHIANHNNGIELFILLDRYFLFEDVAALFIDLLWQKLHDRLDIQETVYFYKNYKIQISNNNLLTDKET